MTYFHPWVIREEDAAEHVPTARALTVDAQTSASRWPAACAAWLNGNILTEEMKVVIQNFIAVTRVRPNDKEVERNNSDEEISDDELVAGIEDLPELLTTKPGGRAGSRRQPADDHHENSVQALAHAKVMWQPRGMWKSVVAKTPVSLLSTQDMLAAARGKRQSAAANEGVQNFLRIQSTGGVSTRAPVRWEAIEQWLERNVRSADVSAEQAAFVEEVARRVYQ